MREPRTMTNFKDVLGSLVVGFGICGISGLWIMLAEQLPSLQKSVEAMNAGTENIAGGNAFGTFMIAVIAAPVVEEILFRGIVLRSMRKFSPAWVAILMSSVLFGVYQPAVSHPRAFRKQSHYDAAGLCAIRSE